MCRNLNKQTIKNVLLDQVAFLFACFVVDSRSNCPHGTAVQEVGKEQL